MAFSCAYHPQSSGLVEQINSVIKTQLAILVETLQIPWPKAFKSHIYLFEIHKLLPFEIIAGCAMHLASTSFDPQQM